MLHTAFAALLAATSLGTAAIAADHVLARVHPGVDASGLNALCQQGAPLDRAGVARVQPLFRVPPSLPHGADRLHRWVRLELRAGTQAQPAVAALATLNGVFERVELDGVAEPGLDTPSLPNDPNFGTQYALHNTGQVINGNAGVVDADCDGPAAWALSSGGPVVVAIIDSGVHPHPDLEDRLLTGWNVLSLVDPDLYGSKSGTSMAAPLVSGLAALLLGTNAWMTPDALWSVIVESADDVESPGFDVLTGWGRIDAAAALERMFDRVALGDLDADGLVNGADLGLTLGAWEEPGLSDLDQDGATCGSDLGVLLSNWTG